MEKSANHGTPDTGKKHSQPTAGLTSGRNKGKQNRMDGGSSGVVSGHTHPFFRRPHDAISPVPRVPFCVHGQGFPRGSLGENTLVITRRIGRPIYPDAAHGLSSFSLRTPEREAVGNTGRGPVFLPGERTQNAQQRLLAASAGALECRPTGFEPAIKGSIATEVCAPSVQALGLVARRLVDAPGSQP